MGWKFNPFTGTLDITGSGGSGGSPGGSDTDIQFNDSGSFGGDSDFTWNKTDNLLTIANNGAVQGNDAISLRAINGQFPDVALGINSISLAFVTPATGTDDGATISLTGGTGGGTSGKGGDVTISGGVAQAGDSNGGDLTFISGDPFGAGTPGLIKFQNTISGVPGILDFTGLTSSAKTFTFPDMSGTLALAGSSSPGGADTDIQFNTSGSFGGSSDLTWDGSVLATTGNITLTKSSPTGYFINTDGSQFAQATLTMYSDFVSLGGHAGVNMGVVITDASTTQSKFIIDKVDSTGAFADNIFDIDLFTKISSFYGEVKISGGSGALALTADSDGGDYNIFSANGSQVLAIYGSAANVLNVKLLDGYLELDTLTASTVPYMDSNKRFASSVVTPTELGYVSGVTSAIQTQLNGKQATLTLPLTPANGGTGIANNSSSTLTISGSFATTLTITGATGVTLPTTGTLATLAGAETLTNKIVSDVVMANDFMSQSATQRSITLTASTNFLVDAVLEIGATFTLTVPATSTVAVTAYITAGNTATLSNKTLTTPTIADFTNAQHSHGNAAGGGQLTGSTALVNSTVTANKLATGGTTARVATSETTTSATYADLTTTTDSVTITIGVNGLALVILYCGTIQNDTASDYALVAYDVSGANTIAAADNGVNMFSMKMRNATATTVGDWAFGASQLLTGLSAGSTTFKMKYRIAVGGTATFAERKISVIPL